MSVLYIRKSLTCFYYFKCSFKRGDAVTAKDEIVCEEGWQWTTDWTVDLNRAVDEDGDALILFMNFLEF